jgi:hypothetical protein
VFASKVELKGRSRPKKSAMLKPEPNPESNPDPDPIQLFNPSPDPLSGPTIWLWGQYFKTFFLDTEIG